MSSAARGPRHDDATRQLLSALGMPRSIFAMHRWPARHYALIFQTQSFITISSPTFLTPTASSTGLSRDVAHAQLITAARGFSPRFSKISRRISRCAAAGDDSRRAGRRQAFMCYHRDFATIHGQRGAGRLRARVRWGVSFLAFFSSRRCQRRLATPRRRASQHTAADDNAAGRPRCARSSAISHIYVGNAAADYISRRTCHSFDDARLEIKRLTTTVVLLTSADAMPS